MTPRSARRFLSVAAILPLPFLAAGLAAAEGLPPITYEFPDGTKATFYGQINTGILQYDDGEKSNTYGLIDNDNSNTRAGMRYSRPLGEDWTFGTRLEFSYAPYSTSNVNILNQNKGDWGFDQDNIRWIDFSFANKQVGTFYLGQGAMATDGNTEKDLSGTTVIGYSKVSASAGAQILRQADGELSKIKISNAFENYNGPRRVRARYDSPRFSGFGLSAAFGRNLLTSDTNAREENLADIAITYDNTFNDTVKVVGSVGYFYRQDGDNTFGGSVSGLHQPTGLNLTFAAGQKYRSGADGVFWYGKLGLLRDFFDWGATALAVDYYSGDDIYFTGNDIEAGNSGSSTSESWALIAVQNVTRWNTELWLTYRNYSYNDRRANYDDGTALYGGLRFRF